MSLSSKLISRVSSGRKRSTHLGFLQRDLSSLRPRDILPEHLKSLDKLTHSLVNKHAPPHGKIWSPTPSLRGEEKALANTIQKYGDGHILSAEQVAFAAEADFGDLHDDPPEPRDLNLWPGTFVEVRRNAIVTHGIILGEIFHEAQWKIVSLSSSGEIWTHMREDIMFELPSIVPQDLASRCGVQTYGESKVQVNARVELLRRIRQLELATAEVQHELGRTLVTLYPKVRSSNPDEWKQITVTEAATIIAPDVPHDFLTRFAIHKYMMNSPNHFVADSVAYRTSHRFRVRPKSHLDRLEKVFTLAHQRSGPMQAFAIKARELIDENRQRAEDSRAEPHSERPRAQNVFTPEDAIIINFLQDAMRAARFIQQDPYMVIVVKIIKAIDRFNGKVDDSAVFQLLTDLGVMAPWQDVVSTMKDLALDQEPEESSSIVAAQNAIVEKAQAKPATKSIVNGEVLGPEDFYTHDLLESVRHDFGNLPVYVIDDANAEELDDGISIEKIPSEPDCTWIHAHIADPTAVLPPTHVFAHQAREMVTTAYYLHRTWPMLPQSMMRTMIHSVGELATAGKPERVLSFSFKVDGTGDIVDYNVRAGIIRNVHRTTYDAVDYSLGRTPFQVIYPFGGQPPPPLPVVNLNEQHQANLHTLQETINRLVKRTLQLPIFTHGKSAAKTIISQKPLYSNPVNPLKPPMFRGFPSLTYTVIPITYFSQGARLLVTQCMTAASRVASRWALDRGVPLLRRTSSQPLTLSDNDFADLLASKDQYGTVPLAMAFEKALTTPAASYTLEPALHWALGIPEGEGYCRVTSPLRRYSDMIAHWQIKHALLHPTSSSPLFSSEWLEKYGRDLILQEKIRKRAEKNHTDFWALQFIRRWIQNPAQPDGPDPLASLVGYASSPPANNYVQNDVQAKFFLPELGLNAFLTGLRNPGVPLITVGEAHKVRIKEIRLSTKPQLMLTV
ncbi:hypothetical protein PILCRDRAFT_68191 [Piloderma croceum F 1598]|uniref:RNB domain-containing protein n=1 Tax=Piloderma croceum (strain F 1598) TaxID=765440 RepID=A0A0C3FIW3_PILCF|nr:hypothetical protein PILCRDRAFT_68191 [Piloderma croceum F 1598]